MREAAPAHSTLSAHLAPEGRSRSPKSLDRSLALRPKAVWESSTPGLAARAERSGVHTDAHHG
eukprot:3227856-Prymnesium_polylepis.1